MTSSDFGYKVLDRALQQYQRGNAPRPGGYAMPIGPEQRMTDQLQLLDGSQPYSEQSDFARSQVLPQVVDALGVPGARQAVLQQDRNRVAEQNLAAQRARRQRELDRFYSRTNGRRMTDELNFITNEYLGSNYISGIQEPITGLNQVIKEGRAIAEGVEGDRLQQGFNALLGEYPELGPVLMDVTQNQGTGRAQRARGEAFAPYLQYTDQDQVYSDPVAREGLYNSVLSQPDSDLINLAAIERDYTSGDPVVQQQARETLIRAGLQPEKLTNIEQPSFQARRPVVGGGGYVDPLRDPDALYINQRAEAVNRLVDDLGRYPSQLPRLEEAFPGLSRKSFASGRTRRFGLNEETGEVDIDPYYDEVIYDADDNPVGGGVYEAKVDKTSPSGRLLSTESLGNGPISKNVLRFLKDNPTFAPSEVSFRTGTPYEGLGYETKELPPEISRKFGSFILDETMSNNRGGSLLRNTPLESTDLIDQAEREGSKSSTLRKTKPFTDAGAEPPNLRGLTYSAAGFGPNTSAGQFTFVDQKGDLVPLQPYKPERALVGKVNFYSGRDFEGRPAVPYSATPRFYGSILPGVTPDGLRFAADQIKNAPASLLPGLSDLIPSAEAVRQTYNNGPMAGGRQVVQDFLAGAPVSLGLAPVLSSPAVAPFAPGIGLGMIGTAGTEAASEIVKQETGKGLGQRLQETAGAISGDTSLVGTGNQGIQRDSNLGRERARRELERVNTPPMIGQGTIRPDNTGIDRSGENLLQRRLRLAGEARAQDSGDFGITELLFGR